MSQMPPDKDKAMAPSKAAALRRLLNSAQTEFLMESHNGLSARIVEEAGFAGIWASGLTLSAQFALRDNNELSWTQIVDVLEFMSDATSIPILLDGDTGYGGFNNFRRLVRKLEQRQIAGVCIEDKLFPKTNSFIGSEQQPLADIDEFCGKIKAGKDSQQDADFCLVARVEALIAGYGMGNALERAHAYADAGADAILIHSKRSDPEEILEFAEQWAGYIPLMIVPTTYYATPMEVFRRAGISVAIWANQLLRASIAAMQSVAGRIQHDESLVEVVGNIVPVSEVFRLQGTQELLEAERRYMPASERATRAIVLAASRGEALASLTADRPKAMVNVAGRPVLQRLVECLRRHGINAITAIVGYRAESIDLPGIERVVNADYASTGELSSLQCAINSLGTDNLLLYGDLLFRDYILNDLLNIDAPLVAVIDSSPVTAGSRGKDFAYCSGADDRGLYRQQVELQQVTAAADWQGRQPDGRWIGMLRVQAEGRQWLEQAVTEVMQSAAAKSAGLPDLLNHLLASGRSIKVMYIQGHWLDVNNLEDLQHADAFAHGEHSVEKNAP